MSEKTADMEFYEKKETVGLVTISSYFNQNLALLNTEDYFKADSIAVAHDGYINYIPLNNCFKRCRYVPLCTGSDRGKGMIRWMKWIKMNDDTYFVCLSTIGVQFFDIELTDLILEYDFKDLSSQLSIPLGACLLKDTLLIGATMGIIVLFKSYNEHLKKVNHLKVSPFLYIDGIDDCIVTISKEEIKSYKIKNGSIVPVAHLNDTLIVFSAMKVYKNLLFIGYITGEISLMTFPDLNLDLKQKLHEKEITGIDYSINKQILLTTSADYFLKAWKLDETHKNLECIFKYLSEDKPYCGIEFIDRNCTEFCCVKAKSLDVNFFKEKPPGGKISNSSNGSSESEDDKFENCLS